MNFQSADEPLREAAISIAVSLAKRAQPPVITRIVNTLFDQLIASKSPEIRISLLQGIGGVAKIAENEDLDKIADDALGKLAKADKESEFFWKNPEKIFEKYKVFISLAHDGTIEAQWNAVVEWAVRLSKATPALTSAFKEASKLAPAVKYIAYRALSDIMQRSEPIPHENSENRPFFFQEKWQFYRTASTWSRCSPSSRPELKESWRLSD